MKARIVEFFQSDAGPLSMSRLLMFGSFVVASIIMLLLTKAGAMNEGYFYGYLAAFTGTYLGGKAIDMKAGTSEKA
jgi:hypothetical protein